MKFKLISTNRSKDLDETSPCGRKILLNMLMMLSDKGYFPSVWRRFEDRGYIN